MLIPWGTPTISDAAKISLEPLFGVVPVGRRLYSLVPQVVEQQDFAGNALPAGWTEVDTAANVVFEAGVMKIMSNGTSNANGVYTGARAAAPSLMQFDYYQPATVTTQPKQVVGFSTAPLNLPANTVCIYPNGTGFDLNRGGNIVNASVFAAGTWYTLRCYYKYGCGDIAAMIWTVQGGAYANETLLGSCSCTEIAGNWYVQWNTWKALVYWIDNLVWRSGYPVDGPTLTYVADATAGAPGSGTVAKFSGLTWDLVSAIGGWDTTNARFKYSFDDGVEAYNASWLTLAELRLVGNVGGQKTFIRLQEQLNSDGPTQQYGGPINGAALSGGGIPVISTPPRILV